MGLFDNGKKWSQPSPRQKEIPIPSIMPPAAIKCINKGQLPRINTETVFLSPGEHVHFVERSILIMEKNVTTGYAGGSHGFSFRIYKGLRYRIGGYRGTPIKENIRDLTRGILYLTSNRIIFVAEKNGFDKRITLITAILPYSNGIVLQMGNKNYKLMLPDGCLAFSAIKMLKR